MTEIETHSPASQGTMLHLYGGRVEGKAELGKGAGQNYPVVELVIDTVILTIFPKGTAVADLAAALTKAGADLAAVAEGLSVAALDD
jgi:hypothetical protein